MFKIKVAGVDLAIKQIKESGEQVKKILNNELEVFARGTVADAQRNAPVDEGILRSAIAFTKADLRVTITVNVDYAAYLEFGTRSFAAKYVSSLPSEWQVFASQYKGGGGGSFQDMVKRITEWVHRKGLGHGFTGSIGVAGTYSTRTRKRTGGKSKQEIEDMQAAYLIARSIMIKGIRPHPYLIPAFEKNRIELIRNLKNQLNAK